MAVKEYEVLGINEEKYWSVYFSVYNNWNKLVKESCELKVSIADIISSNYKVTSAVGVDISNAIAILKAI